LIKSPMVFRLAKSSSGRRTLRALSTLIIMLIAFKESTFNAFNVESQVDCANDNSTPASFEAVLIADSIFSLAIIFLLISALLYKKFALVTI
jgi:hypothetical protein